MNKKQKLGQEPAFATSADLGGEAIYQEGMSKRFYAACTAMQGILSNPNTAHQIQDTFGGQVSVEKSYHAVVVSAFSVADALLEQENQ